MGIIFTLRHSFLAVLFSYKFHCTVDHKYHHSKIRFEHTLKHNLHFFGSNRLALLVPNVCILKIKVLMPEIKLSTQVSSGFFSRHYILVNLRECIIVRPFE